MCLGIGGAMFTFLRKSHILVSAPTVERTQPREKISNAVKYMCENGRNPRKIYIHTDNIVGRNREYFMTIFLNCFKILHLFTYCIIKSRRKKDLK